MSSQPEPWLRGPILSSHPIAGPLLHSIQQAREDLAHWTKDLSDEALWQKPLGLASVGWQIRHIAGSVKRLLTYLEGRQLSAEQIAAMKAESEPLDNRQKLFDELEDAFLLAESIVTAVDPRTWYDVRVVGRKELPTTVGGLVTHIAEHTQRHVGETIITAKVVLKIHP